MPIYLYLNDETGETREILQGMNDQHVYADEGVEWRRVFLSPNTSIDTKINPFSSEEFIRKTNKKGTVGDVMDLSAELSQKREESHGGEDPVKRQMFKDYEKKVGQKHIKDKPKIVETKSAIIDFSK